MREVMSVVDAIRDLLPAGGRLPSGDLNEAKAKAGALAEAYARWRGQAASRLESFAITLEAGDEYQALQLAEFEPRLPDFIAQLSFPEEPQWVDYCARHGLTPPPVLDTDVVQTLQRIYMRGITTSSPYYQDCLAAMAHGDSDRALKLIRSIVRLNPRDADARREMERMLRHRLEPKLAALRTALMAQDHVAALAWMDELDKAGGESMLRADEVYQAGLRLRMESKREEAAADAETLLLSAEAEMGLGPGNSQWQLVSAATQKIRKLGEEYELTFGQEVSLRLSRLENYATQERGRAQTEEEFQQALATFGAFAERIGARLRQGETAFSPSEAGKAELTMAELWDRIKDFRLPIPESAHFQMHDLAAALQGRAQGLDAAPKRKPPKSATLLVVTMIFFATLGWGYIYRCAHDYVTQLETMQGQRMVAGANKLMALMASSVHLGVSLSPGLRSKMALVKKWADLELTQLHETEQKLEKVESLVLANLESMEPETLMEQLKEATAAVKSLAPDLMKLPQQKLEVLQAQADSRFKALAERNIDQARKRLSHLERLAAQLNYQAPTAAVVATVASLQSELHDIAAYEHPSVPGLRLTAEIETSLKQVRDTTAGYAAQVTALKESQAAMARAGKLADYQTALERYAKLPFREARRAQSMASTFPTADEMGAKVFFAGNADAWDAARRQGKTLCRFYPESAATEDESAALAALLNDPNLSSGAAKKLLDALHLDTALETEKGRWQVPLIRLMDTLVRFPGGDLVAKAYLMHSLYDIMERRGIAWGLHYCPELAAAMEELDGITTGSLRSGDWNRPNQQKKYSSKLKAFFDKIAARKPFYDLAESYQGIVARVVDAGVNYAGYIDDTPAARLTIKGDAPFEVWGISAENHGPMPVPLAGGAIDAGSIKSLEPFSPLFIIPEIPAKLTQERLAE